MTISVTPEELQAHEQALKTWGLKRAQAVSDWLQLQPVAMDCAMFKGPERRFDRGKLVAMLDQWDKDNPTPKLIPAV